MSTGCLIVPVEDKDRIHNSTHIQEDSKQQIFCEEWKTCRGWWKKIGDKNLKEDNKSKQDGNRHGCLFSGIGWKVEDADAEEGYENAWCDQVDGVEEGLTTD